MGVSVWEGKIRVSVAMISNAIGNMIVDSIKLESMSWNRISRMQMS